MKKLPITVAMVIYNEEKLLKRALESCADIVDEIIIVHDGPCKDNSLKIARQFTNKIFIKKAMGAPEPHRPFTFAKAKNEWIIQLDADEFLDNDFRKALPTLIKKNVSGYKVRWIEEYNGKKIFNMVKEVLFQKNQVFFIGAPCEYIKPIDPKRQLRFAPVNLINNPGDSKSNYGSWSGYTKKYSSFAKVCARMYVLPFKKIPTWNYKGNDWDTRIRLKINHPLLFGVLGMNVKYIIEIFKHIISIKSEVSLHAISHLMWYNSYLYLQVFKLNHRI